MIHVLIVEDDPMARKLFEIILQESDRYIVTAAIESASLAEFYCMTSTVDLILMDVCTALRSSGLEAAAKIKKIYPKKKIIIVTSQPECDFVERARKSGVESFWYKDPSAEHLLDVMDRTVGGESVYPDKLPFSLRSQSSFVLPHLRTLRLPEPYTKRCISRRFSLWGAARSTQNRQAGRASCRQWSCLL